MLLKWLLFGVEMMVGNHQVQAQMNERCGEHPKDTLKKELNRRSKILANPKRLGWVGLFVCLGWVCFHTPDCVLYNPAGKKNSAPFLVTKKLSLTPLLCFSLGHCRLVFNCPQRCPKPPLSEFFSSWWQVFDNLQRRCFAARAGLRKETI